MRDFERPGHSSPVRDPARPGKVSSAPGPDRLLGNGMLAALGPGAPLPPALRLSMAGVFGGDDFADVRVHTDTAAAESARGLTAYAYTVGTHIVFGDGQYRPGTDAGQRLIAHELAHTVQQRKSGPARVQAQGPPGSWRVDPDEMEAGAAADRVPRRAPWAEFSDTDVTRLLDCVKELGPLHRADCYDIVLGHRLAGETLASQPAAARRDLEIRNIRFGVDWAAALGQYFGAKPPPVPALATGQKVDVASSVDPGLAAGARMAGTFMLTQMIQGNLTGIAPNDVVNVAIPAAGQVFRFVRIGATALLIEQVGPIIAAQATVANTPVVDRTFTVSGRTYQLDTNWLADDLARVTAALARFPESVLPPLPTTFKRAATFDCPPDTPTCDPATPAKHTYNYAAARHEITFYDTAFTNLATDARRVGTWPWLYGLVAHEVGHAHDKEVLAKAYAAYKRSSAAGRAQAERRLLNTRSGSGVHLTVTTTATGTRTFSEAAEPARDSVYRKAAIADGLQVGPPLSHGLSDYSEKSWQENYAESFAVYVDDPELLRDLRPTVYAYFAARFAR